MMEEKVSLLEFINVTKTYGPNIALQNIDLKIDHGKIVGLLGPNGSGKTTMIKLINGLLQPNSGEVLINGKKPGVESKKAISFLPDSTYLPPWMKISSAIKFFTEVYDNFSAERAYSMLERLKISEKAMFSTLSKGNKEKIQLMLVMSRKAQFYILDEPIGSVDPAARDYILKTIINNYSPTASVILSTHLISDVEHILDEVIFLQNGNVVRQGNVDDLRVESGLSIDELFRDDFRA